MTPSIYIGNIVYRQEEIEHSQSMRRLYSYFTQQGLRFTEQNLIGDAMVSRSRSQTASQFLRSDYEVLVTIDSDIAFNPGDVVKLTELAVEKGVAGACYIKRYGGATPAVRLPDQVTIGFGPEADPVEVEYVSTGFMAVHRRVLEALVTREDMPLCHKGYQVQGQDFSFWPFYHPIVLEVPGDHHYLSEDWAFCLRAREEGFPAWLDTSIRVMHMGAYGWTLEDMLTPRKTEQAWMFLQKEGGVYKVGVPRE